MASVDKRRMRDRIGALVTELSRSNVADRQVRIDLVQQFERMFIDLDKNVHRCDDHGKRSRVFGQIGAAASASSAVAGTALVTGTTNALTRWIGYIAAACGIFGSTVGALKLSDSVQTNRSDHAQYLPISRKMSAYSATLVPETEAKEISDQIGQFADEIGQVAFRH